MALRRFVRVVAIALFALLAACRASPMPTPTDLLATLPICDAGDPPGTTGAECFWRAYRACPAPSSLELIVPDATIHDPPDGFTDLSHIFRLTAADGACHIAVFRYVVARNTRGEIGAPAPRLDQHCARLVREPEGTLRIMGCDRGADIVVAARE